MSTTEIDIETERVRKREGGETDRQKERGRETEASRETDRQV